MKFYKGRLKFVIPLSIVVAVSSGFMLVNKYNEVPTVNKVLIVVGAAVLAAFISYFLFPQAGEDRPDDFGPY
ncbi:acyltransferase [Solibacillus sp. FSL H8-0538]|uniref:acyltransferase n=1 Tax=Solibacillus sp. FSL H8-0538 TaxID=2921400 RepID=UPI0030F85C35